MVSPISEEMRYLAKKNMTECGFSSQVVVSRTVGVGSCFALWHPGVKLDHVGSHGCDFNSVLG